MKTYAAYYKNQVRIDSSSGGLFSLLASKFDVVYGVQMDEKIIMQYLQDDQMIFLL